jgi:LysM repeat protein
MQTYVVKSGDSLSLISQKFFGDFSQTMAIQKANNISNPNLIHPGTVLQIPDVIPATVNDQSPAAVTYTDFTPVKPKSKNWLWVLLVAAGVGGGIYYYNKNKKKKKTPAKA